MVDVKRLPTQPDFMMITSTCAPTPRRRSVNSFFRSISLDGSLCLHCRPRQCELGLPLNESVLSANGHPRPRQVTVSELP